MHWEEQCKCAYPDSFFSFFWVSVFEMLYIAALSGCSHPKNVLQIHSRCVSVCRFLTCFDALRFVFVLLPDEFQMLLFFFYLFFHCAGIQCVFVAFLMLVLHWHCCRQGCQAQLHWTWCKQALIVTRWQHVCYFHLALSNRNSYPLPVSPHPRFPEVFFYTHK